MHPCFAIRTMCLLDSGLLGNRASPLACTGFLFFFFVCVCVCVMSFSATLCSHKRAHNPFSSSFTLLLQQWPVGKPSCVHSLMMLSHKAHCNLCSNFDSGSWHAVDGLFWLLGSQRFGDLTFVRLFLKDEAKCALLPMLLCHLMRH